MKYLKQCLGIILSITFHFACAQTSSTSEVIKGAKKTIQQLSAPTMHGRGYINNGDQIAANYIKNEFKNLGLKNFNDSYFQKFPININVFPRRMKLKVGRKRLKPGVDFIIHPNSKAGKGRGRLLWLDTLLLKEPQRVKDFLKKDLSRTILVYKAKYLQQLQRNSQLKIAFFKKLEESKAAIELNDKLTTGYSTRPLNRPILKVKTSSFDKTAKKAKFRVDNQFLQGYQTQNVIGYLEGQQVPDSFMVFTAHYDHMGRMGKKIYFPGANDNASGVAMLLELAKHYSKPQNKPKHSILFIAFGAEEVGLIGSYYFVKRPPIDLGNIAFLVNFDILGTGDDGIKVVNGTVFRKEFDRLKRINQQKKYLPKIEIRGKAAISDHYFFTENGVPSFYMYTLGGIQAYHDIFDKYETLPLTKFEGVFHLMVDFVKTF
ncbi:hypothetical protein BKI52_32220 [marine bacterium AO1-C]|nr:hypothetical protein BKI52_32220 [marine bacterium AO1-C]